MKVMRIVTRLNIGGPARHVAILEKGLEEQGIQTVLVTGRIGQDEGDMSYLLGEKAKSSFMIPELRRDIHPIRDVVCLWKLFQIMRRERPDIVHTHMAKAGTLGRLAAILARVPVKVHTFHGHVFQGYFSSFPVAFFLAIERFLASRSNCLIAVSDHVQKEIYHRYRLQSDRKVKTIPIGLDLKPFLERNGRKDALREELKLPSHIRMIGIVGRLVPIKDHLFFIHVAEALLKKHEDLHFVIVGRGGEELFLKRLVHKKGLSPFVTFLGWREDLPRIYSDLDVVVLTSRNEGTPVSLIEAMASGKAVVATRVGGVPDVVQEGVTGYTVSVGALPLFVEKVELLLNQPELRKQMGEAGRMWVSERYSKEKLLRNIRSLYEELLRERKT